MTHSPFVLTRRSAMAAMAGLAAWSAVRGAQAHENHRSASTAVEPSATMTKLRGPLPDVRVVDAARRRRRLVSEVFARRIVVIDFVLTDCSTVCPIVSAAMAGAQDLLGRRLGPDAALVSVALDPLGGTPDELRDYGARFGAGPAWSFVNVPQESLGEVLRRLGGPTAGSDHAPMVVVLDPVRGEFRRLLGLPSAETITAAVEAALAARGPA